MATGFVLLFFLGFEIDDAEEQKSRRAGEQESREAG